MAISLFSFSATTLQLVFLRRRWRAEVDEPGRPVAPLEAEAGEEGEGDIVSDLKLNKFTHKTSDKNILLYTGWPGGRFHRPNQDVGRYFGPLGDKI